jgi:hypothetical protein
MTHPLTDEMMHKIHGNRPGYSNPFDEDDMCAAYDKGADWQLEQVIKWIETCPGYDLEYPSDCLNMIADLKKAMRPQEES